MSSKIVANLMAPTFWQIIFFIIFLILDESTMVFSSSSSPSPSSIFPPSSMSSPSSSSSSPSSFSSSSFPPSSSPSSSSSSSVRPRLVRLFSRLFDGKRLSENDDERAEQLKSQLAITEQQLIEFLDMDMAERRKKRIEVYLLRMRLELEHLITTYNNSGEKMDASSVALRQKLSTELCRLNSHLFIYNRVRIGMDGTGQVSPNSFRWALEEPLYGAVFIHFLLEGADFCAGAKVGETVHICPDLEQFNFLEELIKQILATLTPEKVIQCIKFEFGDKNEQINNFNALFGPNGILTLKEQPRQPINGTEMDAVIRQIEKKSETRHKKHLKRKVIREKVFKLHNKMAQNMHFELELAYEEGIPPRREGQPKLLTMTIKKMPTI